ncbi:peptidoglycan editing factor PgeF [Achromobacter aloeverae]|uniref:Purine nucleoside phosphorylase n=1 Tax=Achromobacter aloeverae TaxID=1750518 RepID=A0A4Q1HCS9_9BURK|nr:peptidoglycan editing factor PgeF [Achromobacter aloeverae]RXN83681.1 peptidoglycan editing factor PgeF [Achromobacter aloeverae]
MPQQVSVSDTPVLPVVSGPSWPGLRYFCTTRGGGVGRAPHDTLNLGLRAGDDPESVRENRRRLRAMLPAEPLWLRQVHGSEVIDADTHRPDAAGDDPAADSAVTAQAGRVLAVMAADCLPVMLVDRDATVLGAAHAGWRGLSGGVLENVLAALRRKNPAATQWRAWVGPGIGPAAFEVGEDVLRAFTAGDDGQAAALFRPYPGRPGKWLADLAGLAALRLRRAGVQDVHVSGLCTYTDRDRFFSYRRDGATGRMAMLAWLQPGIAAQYP